MDINTFQKAVLDGIDGDIESSFLDGVTVNSSSYLPKLPDYDKIPASLRPIGRKGILSTFAGLIKQLGLVRPTKVSLDYLGGISTFNEQTFYQVGIDGRFSVFGRVTASYATSNPALFLLPPSLRPATTLLFPVVTGTGASSVILSPGGIVSLNGTIAIGGWISLSGISFYPG